MSKKLLHFWPFQGRFTFKDFFVLNIFIKIFKFHHIKIPENQKAPPFEVFALRAICKKNVAQRRGNKRHFCAKSQDLDTLHITDQRNLTRCVCMYSLSTEVRYLGHRSSPRLHCKKNKTAFACSEVSDGHVINFGQFLDIKKGAF